MFINSSKKKSIQNASDEAMFCNGTVLFGLNYFGTSTTMEALVSSDLEDEVLLGWQTLKSLKIIHEDFPKPLSFGPSVPENVKQRALCAKSAPLEKTTIIKNHGPQCLKTFSTKNHNGCNI